MASRDASLALSAGPMSSSCAASKNASARCDRGAVLNGRGPSSPRAGLQRRARIEDTLLGPQTASSSQALPTHGKKHTSLIAYVHESRYREGWGPVAKPQKRQTDRGNAIKELRGIRAITREARPSRTGRHPTYISDMERGARNPS